MKLFGLAALALSAPALATAEHNGAKAQYLTVTMTKEGFVPRLINLRHGALYVIRFVNRSDRGHDFRAPDFFRVARIDRASRRLIKDQKVDLDPGQAVSVRLVAPIGPGRFPFKSVHLSDAASGMSGYILIR